MCMKGRVFHSLHAVLHWLLLWRQILCPRFKRAGKQTIHFLVITVFIGTQNTRIHKWVALQDWRRRSIPVLLIDPYWLKCHRLILFFWMESMCFATDLWTDCMFYIHYQAWLSQEFKDPFKNLKVISCQKYNGDLYGLWYHEKTLKNLELLCLSAC